MRSTPALRALMRETELAPRRLIAPLFVKEGIADAVPIASMPGQFQHTVESLRKTAADIRSKGVLAFVLFGDQHGATIELIDDLEDRLLALLRRSVRGEQPPDSQVVRST